MSGAWAISSFARRILAVLASAGVCAVAAAAELWELEWTEAATDHFTIATTLPMDQAAELAEELENFRTVVQLFLKIGAFEDRVPTKIYVLPALLPEFGLNQGRRGYFVPGVRENYAVMTTFGDTAGAALKHEYVHFLARNFNSQVYPTWLDEGLADLLSTLTVRDGALEFGRPLPGQLNILKPGRHGDWLRFDSVLEQRGTHSLGDVAESKFYAQSWLLTQYLAVGRGETNALANQVEKYLEHVERGESINTAFEGAFRMRVNQLETTLKGYAGRRIKYYAAPLAQPLPAITVRAEPMAPDRVAAELAMLLLTLENGPTGTVYCEQAVELNAANALAVSCKAFLLLAQERFAEAEAQFQRALALAPTDPRREADYGLFFFIRALLEEERGASRDVIAPLLDEARRRFARARDLDPRNVEAPFLMGASYLDENGADAPKAVESLEAAHSLLPGDEQIQKMLAQAYIELGEEERARGILRGLLARAHPAAVEELRTMLVSIEPPAAPVSEN